MAVREVHSSLRKTEIHTVRWTLSTQGKLNSQCKNPCEVRSFFGRLNPWKLFPRPVDLQYARLSPQDRQGAASTYRLLRQQMNPSLNPGTRGPSP